MDFSGHVQSNLHTVWGTAHSSKERRRSLFLRHFRPSRNRASVLWCRFPDSWRKTTGKTAKNWKTLKNGWVGIWRRDTCEDPGMPHRPKQAGCCCADWSGPAVQQKVQCVGRIRDGPAGVSCHFCIPLRRQSRMGLGVLSQGLVCAAPQGLPLLWPKLACGAVK